MYLYYIYYDVRLNDKWVYNLSTTVRLDKKGKHRKAEKEALIQLNMNGYDEIRIMRVECD